ncbi:VanZ family protein [Acidobacteriota bacterium]
MNRFPKLWLWMTIFWMMVLFVFSTSFFSSELTDKINAPFNIRFLAHIVVYFILGFFVSGAIELNFKWKRRFLIALIFCILYAFSDELHQYFEPTRAAKLIDVIKDSVGAWVGILVYRKVYLERMVKKGL